MNHITSVIMLTIKTFLGYILPNPFSNSIKYHNFSKKNAPASHESKKAEAG